MLCDSTQRMSCVPKSFEGVCFENYRHPDPRRMWTGGAERQSVDRIRWIRGNPRDPLDPGMGSFLRLLGMKNNENEHPISKLSILLRFLLVFVIDF